MKRKPPNKNRGKSPQPQSDPEPLILDHRAMEKAMWEVTRLIEEQGFTSEKEVNAFLQEMMASGVPPESTKETPLDRAQDLMYQAWEARGKRRVQLARQALEISEDCADAYVLLAEETAHNAGEARELYEKGVQAGERSLGPEIFQEAAGQFWGILETRPYMRARAGLAECLWALDEHQQAIEHFTDLIRLNPGDNQGLRYRLFLLLLTEGADDAIGKLLKQYKGEASAAWQYNHALWLFRREGQSKRAGKQLEKALLSNPFVPVYLFGVKKLPRRMPDYIGLGDENEAVDYIASAAPAWYDTEGALEWIMSHMEKMIGPMQP